MRMPLAPLAEASTIEKTRFPEHASDNRDAIAGERRAADAEHDTSGPEVGREGNWDVAGNNGPPAVGGNYES
jgi:hypothetical protein